MLACLNGIASLKQQLQGREKRLNSCEYGLLGRRSDNDERARKDLTSANESLKRQFALEQEATACRPAVGCCSDTFGRR